jgi:branched-chain amino acid transport system ATP-binding protein
MLEVRGLEVSYGSVQVLWDVSIEVGEGEVVSIIGNNGAGKSTLTKSIMGMVKPSKGEISFKGRDITGRSTHQIIRLGLTMVPEGRELFPHMSVRDNLLLGAHSIKDQGKIQENMEYVLSVFPRLKKRLSQLAGTMSGGEQQMLAIARSLMLNPELLILDEPSLGLAPVMVKRVFDTVEKLKREGLTLIICAQNIKQALNISERGYVIESGRITMEDDGKALLENPLVKEAYLGI